MPDPAKTDGSDIIKRRLNVNPLKLTDPSNWTQIGDYPKRAGRGSAVLVEGDLAFFDHPVDEQKDDCTDRCDDDRSDAEAACRS